MRNLSLIAHGRICHNGKQVPGTRCRLTLLWKGVRTLKIFGLIAAGCGSFLTDAAWAAILEKYTSLEVQPHSSFSRLNISLDESFKPKIVNGPKGFEIRIPAAEMLDLGIPMGEVSEFNRQLKSLQDSRIGELSVLEKDSELIIRGKYRFPSGKNALAKPEMELFDFYRKEDGKLVIDFWYRKGPTVAEADQQRKLQAMKNQDQKRKEILRQEEERRVQKEKRLEESRSALRFCETPLSRENSLWVKYRAEHPILNFNQYFPEFVPDHGFRYQEPSGKSEEAQMVRLAIKLSRENKHALVVKTVDFLKAQYPHSIHQREMEFLKASSYYRLEMVEQGKVLIEELSKNGRKTEVGVQSTAFLGAQAFRNSQWLAAHDLFMRIRKDFPDHPMTWLFRYGIAESLYQIRQYDQARPEFEWLSKNALNQQIRNESGFKAGDLYFNRNQYAQAITAYEMVLKANPEGGTRYPHVYMNLGEAYFQLEEFNKAEENFGKYLIHARTHPTAWKASLRVAEIRSMRKPSDSEKNFTETVNQYPMTPGAAIARLRMIPCGNHGGFDLNSGSRYVNSDEVKKIEDPEAFYSTSLSELIGLTEVRMLLSFQEDEKAIDKGLARLRENPSLEARKLIEKGIVGGVKRLLEKRLQENDYYGAIALLEKHGDYLPAPTFDPVCDEMRLKIARFAADKKLASLALRIIEPFRASDENGLKLAADEIRRDLQLDSTDEMENRAMVEAKSLWNGEKFKLKDEKESAVFLEKLSSIRDQSRLSSERDLLRSLYHRARGEDAKAYEFAKRLSTGMPRFSSRTKAQAWAYVAELAAKNGDHAAAAKAFRESRLIVAKLTEKDEASFEYRHFPNAPSLARLYAAEGEQLENLQKWKEAVAIYTEAIENKLGGNHVLYAHARAILKDGGRDSRLVATQSLEKIKQSQDDDVWKNLAQKALDQIAKEGKEDEKRK
jgi:tetratricopeptide (TPR) repeat protein